MRKRDPKPMPGGRTAWSVEPIWVLSRDGFVLMGGDDVYEASTPRLGRDTDATGHPYQKPLEVMEWLIGKTSSPLIIDPFMGSGTTLLAAKNLGRKAIGIENDEQWCDTVARRLAQEVLPLHAA
jgi:site-specific DNA-methyltransferase (adenine-specific)